MCDCCRRSPCDSRCPNAPESPVYAHCDECGCVIRDGDDYYTIGGGVYCENCIEDARKEAEVR